MHSQSFKKTLIKRATESVGILLTLLLVFSAIVYAITWVPGGPPQAAPGAGNVELPTGSSVWDTDGTNVYRTSGNVGIGTTSPSAGLKFDVEGKIGATEYCDQDGNNCTAAGGLGGNLTCTTTETHIYRYNQWYDLTTPCPAGYTRTGCSLGSDATDSHPYGDAEPSGANGCKCFGYAGSHMTVYCHAYCCKGGGGGGSSIDVYQCPKITYTTGCHGWQNGCEGQITTLGICKYCSGGAWVDFACAQLGKMMLE